MAVKVVVDVSLAGEKSVKQLLADKIQKQYELRIVVYGPDIFLFFRLQIFQHDDSV